MTNEEKLSLIQQHIQTYYEAGGSTLPSAYKSAVLDMINTVAVGEDITDNAAFVPLANLEIITDAALKTVTDDKKPKIVKTKWAKTKENEHD